MAIVERSVRKGVDLIPTCVFTSKNSEISQSTRLEIAKGVSHIQDSSKVRREENQSGNQADASKRLRNDSTKEVKIERDIVVNANVVNRKDVSNVKQTDTVSKTKDKSLHSPNVKKSSTSNSINSVSKNKESTGKNQEDNLSDKVAGGNCSSIRTSIARNETVNNESNSCKGTKINSEVSRKNVKDDKSCTGDAVGEKDVKTGSSKIKHSSLQDGVSDNSIIKSPAGINSQERKLDKDKSTSVKLKENACDKIDTNGRVSDIKGKDEMKNKTNPIDKAFIVKNKDNVVEKTEACDKTKVKTKNSSEEKSTLSSVKGGSIQVKNNISDRISTLEKITNKNPAKMPDKSIPLDKVSIARSKFSSADKSPLSNKVTASKSKDNEKDKAGTNDDQTSINSNAVHNNITTKVGDQSKNFGSEKVSPVRNKDNSNDKVDTTEKTSARINKDKEEKSDKTSVVKRKDNLKDKGSRLDNLTNSMSKDNIKESLCNNNKTTSKNKDNLNDKDPPNDKKRLKGKMNTQDVESSGTKMSTLKSKDIVQNKIDNSDKSSMSKDKGSVQEKVAIAKFSDEKSKNIMEEKGNKMSNVKIKEDMRNKMGSAEKSPISKEKSDPGNVKSKDSLLEKSNKSEKDDKNDSQKKIETKDKKGEKLSNLKSEENMDKRITVDKKKGKCNDQDRPVAADKTSNVKSKQNILDKSGSSENAVKGKEYIQDKGSSSEKSIKDKDDKQKVKSNDKALSKGGDQSIDKSTDKSTDKSKDHTPNKYNSNEKLQKEVKDKMSHTEEISAKFSRSTQEKNSHINKMAKCNDSLQDKCCFEEKSTKDSVLNKVGSTEKTEVRNKDAAKDDVTLTEKLKIKDKVVKDDSVAKTATKIKEYSTNKLSNKDSTKDIPNSNVDSATKSKDTEVKKTTNEKPSADVDKISTKINVQDKCDVQDKIGTRNTDDKSIKKSESDKISSVQSNDVQVNTQATSKVKKTKEEKNVDEKSLNKDRVQNETGLTINKISSIKDNLQNVKSMDDNALTIIYRSDNSEENTTKKTGVINLLTDKTSECTKFKDCPDKNKESQHKTQQNNCDITKTDTDKNINKDAPNKMKRDDIDGGSSDNLVDEIHNGRIKNNRGNRPSSYPSIYYKNEFPALQQRSVSQQGLSSVDNAESTSRDCTLSAVDYAKSRFQNVTQSIKLEDIIKPKLKNNQLVTEFKSKWENNEGVEGQSPIIPLPKLNNQKHLRGRSQSVQSENSHGVPIRPFLTKGSVAERVLLFECCPERALDRSSKSKSLLYNTWKSTTGDIQHKTRFWEITREKGSSARSIYVQKDKENVELSRATALKIQKSSTPRHIPQFFYPQGRPLLPVEIEAQLQEIKAAFSAFKDEKVEKEEFGIITKACNLPLYWKVPLFEAVVGSRKSYVRCNMFLEYWKRLVSICHDEASQFVAILSRGSRKYLLPDDFIAMIQDIIDTHPGLTFLKEATEFHSRYIHTVISRIYYCVNRSWSGKINIAELRKSNFLQVLALLEKEEDINQITDYFSYEHFYVIYCKFWELDKDHDLFIDKYDLQRHNEGAISSKMIDRIFSGAVTQEAVHKKGKMSYTDFVWFLLSEEDKRHPRSIEYWFRCMDLDGDGYLSMYEMEYFYEEQLQRMEVLGIETLPFKDCLCQMLDMIRPKVPGCISLSDLKSCKMTPLFFDTFFNLEKYLDHEQRDPFASQREQDSDSCEMTDWDRYATEEYELLVAEEGTSDQADDLIYEDYDQDDELSNIHKINGSSIVQRSSSAANNVNIDDDDDDDDFADSDVTYY